jgi:hypothetical protein
MAAPEKSKSKPKPAAVKPAAVKPAKKRAEEPTEKLPAAADEPEEGEKPAASSDDDLDDFLKSLGNGGGKEK